MIKFAIAGPYACPTYRKNGARYVDEKQLPEFWGQTKGLREKNGCYVFGMKREKKIIPFYVGMTKVGFGSEVFQDHKKLKYYEAINRAGEPVFFFLYLKQVKKPGGMRLKAIKELETYLIRQCLIVNNNLLNIRGTNFPVWGISGFDFGKFGKTADVFDRTIHSDWSEIEEIPNSSKAK